MSFPSRVLKIEENYSTGISLDESNRMNSSPLCIRQTGLNSSLGNLTPNISEEINFVKYFSPDRNCTTVPIEIITTVPIEIVPTVTIEIVPLYRSKL